MKQKISEEQWLSVNRRGPSYTIEHNGESLFFNKMTIGGMIEFLGDDWYEYLMTIKCERIEAKFKERYVLDPCEDHLPDNEDLCNELWEAVKYKLKE